MDSNKRFTIIGALAVVVLICVGLGMKSNADRAHQQSLKTRPLTEVKKEHTTELKNPGPVPGANSVLPPQNARAVTYESNGRLLTAWVVHPEEKGKHPGLLYLHDGYGISGITVERIQPFVDAGFVVLMPTWRGEQGNAGNFEMCYGEVDDALQALSYLKKMPEVDDEKLYAVGTGVGGTMVMLLAESTNQLQKVAACGGIMNMTEIGPYSGAPFKDDEQELILRSPASHVNDLSCPALMIYASKEEADQKRLAGAREMAADARELNKKLQAQEISDISQEEAMSLAFPLIVDFFKQN